MYIKFDDQKISLISGKENGQIHPDDEFDPTFKRFLLGLSLLLLKESKRIKESLEKKDITITDKDILYMDSVARVLTSFQKVFTIFPIFKCLLNSKFTVEEISMIYTTLNTFNIDIKKKIYAKLFKDTIPELKKKLDDEIKDVVKLNNDWYMVALGVVQGKVTIEPF